jgi:ATP-dependent helicase/nuclease subunit B
LHELSREDFRTAASLESSCVEAAMDGALVLAGHGRLARRILHLCRLRLKESAADGWISPAVFALNRWVRSAHDFLWETSRPLGKAAALRLWHDCAAREEPPSGLSLSPSVYLQLQSTFDLLERHRLAVALEGDGAPLAEWRQRVTRRFRESLAAGGFAPWAEVVDAVRLAVRHGGIGVPSKVLLAGFDDPTPLENTLFEALSEVADVNFCEVRSEAPAGNAVRLFASPEQECMAVSAEVLEEWNLGRRKLGVVFLESGYGDRMGTCLDVLAAGEVLREGSLRYNLTQGTPLRDHPLFLAGLIPLRVAEEANSATLLSSLLTSPYVRPTLHHWRRETVELLRSPDASRDMLTTLGRLCEQHFPLRSLEVLVRVRQRPLEGWLAGLANVWRDLGFPRFAGREARTTDALAWGHLQEILSDLRREAGDLKMEAPEAVAWLGAAAANVEVIEKTPETAGIQVLSLEESRGLSFERLWVVGCHGRALPRPAKDHPFLSPGERTFLEESKPEGQWAAARRQLGTLYASSDTILFSRASQDGDERPFLPCPFLSDESSGGGEGRTLDPWRNPPAPWLRARWLRGGLRGLGEPRDSGTFLTAEQLSVRPPASLTVTADLEALLQCPYRYLCSRQAKLEPLPDVREGIPPHVRGSIIHEILDRFAAEMIEDLRGWPQQEGAATDLLGSIAEEILVREAGSSSDSPFWRAERLRLLGDGFLPGVLTAWLREERRRAQAGWRFAAAESPFDDLSLGATKTKIRGRVDRVDVHPQEGLAVWDYKTGDPPAPGEVLKSMAHPQLPVYAAAVLAGRLSTIEVGDFFVRGGYIPLKRAPAVKVEPLKAEGRSRADLNWRDFLPSWERAVEKRLEGPARGFYPADPNPPFRTARVAGACTFCAYSILCGHFDAPARAPADAEEDSP